jgi:hypothetical protein
VVAKGSATTTDGLVASSPLKEEPQMHTLRRWPADIPEGIIDAASASY